jgi:hypothetical protein
MITRARVMIVTITRTRGQLNKFDYFLPNSLRRFLESKKHPEHRNLGTRRRMHLCMQDDLIGPNFMGLDPADMAILPPSLITIK